MALPNMLSLPLDPETGYIPSPDSSGFTIEKKKAFVDQLANSHGDKSLTRISEAMGFHHSTVMRHLALDKAFKRDVDEAKRWFAYRVEGVLQECALDPKKSLDRIAYLRAYMPERYARTEINGPPATINITITGDSVKKFSKVVDAEVIEEKSESANSGPQVVDITSTVENQ